MINFINEFFRGCRTTLRIIIYLIIYLSSSPTLFFLYPQCTHALVRYKKIKTRSWDHKRDNPWGQIVVESRLGWAPVIIFMDDRRFQKLSLKPLSRLGVDQTFEQLSVQDKYNRRIKIFKSNCRISPDAASYLNLAIPFPSVFYLFFFVFRQKKCLILF